MRNLIRRSLAIACLVLPYCFVEAGQATFDLKIVEESKKPLVNALLKEIDANKLVNYFGKKSKKLKRSNSDLEFTVWNPESIAVPTGGQLFLLTLELADFGKPRFLFFQSERGKVIPLDQTMGAPDQDCGVKDQTREFPDLSSIQFVHLDHHDLAAFKPKTVWPACAGFSQHEFTFMTFYLLGSVASKAGDIDLGYECGFDGDGPCDYGPSKGKSHSGYRQERVVSIEPCLRANCGSISVKQRELEFTAKKSSRNPMEYEFPKTPTKVLSSRESRLRLKAGKIEEVSL